MVDIKNVVCVAYNSLYLKVQFEAVFTDIPVSNDEVFKNMLNMVLHCVILNVNFRTPLTVCWLPHEYLYPSLVENIKVFPQLKQVSGVYCMMFKELSKKIKKQLPSQYVYKETKKHQKY